MAAASACSLARVESTWATADSIGGLGGVHLAPGDQLAPVELALAIVIALAIEHGHPRLGRLRLGFDQGGLGVLHVGARPLDLRLLVDDGGPRSIPARPVPG